MLQVVVDSSFLVALINPRDHWRNPVLAIRQALLQSGCQLIYFDCVVTESISTAARRLYEQGKSSEVAALFHRLDEYTSTDTITWVLPDVPRLYPEALSLVRLSIGKLNFNDALIALACRDRQIPLIASFDADFDALPWLRRLARPEDVPSP